MARPKKPDHGAELAAQHGIQRSPHWRTVEKNFRKARPYCEACGAHKTLSGGKGIQVHHRYPFHDCVLAGRQDLELDMRNLVGLCENEKGIETEDHHEIVGHLGNFKSFNPTVLEDSQGRWHGEKGTEIKASSEWQKAAGGKPKSYPDMTEEEKKAFREELDRKFPEPKS